jgi:hypothetical protein
MGDTDSHSNLCRDDDRAVSTSCPPSTAIGSATLHSQSRTSRYNAQKYVRDNTLIRASCIFMAWACLSTVFLPLTAVEGATQHWYCNSDSSGTCPLCVNGSPCSVSFLVFVLSSALCFNTRIQDLPKTLSPGLLNMIIRLGCMGVINTFITPLHSSLVWSLLGMAWTHSTWDVLPWACELFKRLCPPVTLSSLIQYTYSHNQAHNYCMYLIRLVFKIWSVFVSSQTLDQFWIARAYFNTYPFFLLAYQCEQTNITTLDQFWTNPSYCTLPYTVSSPPSSYKVRHPVETSSTINVI